MLTSLDSVWLEPENLTVKERGTKFLAH